jgi:hypothetical protein
VGSTSVSALLICVHGSGGGFAHCHTHLLREVFTVEHGTAQCQLVVQCVIPRKSHSASPSVQLEGLTYGSKKATANLASQRFLFFGWKMVGPPHQFSHLFYEAHSQWCPRNVGRSNVLGRHPQHHINILVRAWLHDREQKGDRSCYIEEDVPRDWRFDVSRLSTRIIHCLITPWVSDGE